MSEKKPLDQSIPVAIQVQKDGGNHSHQSDYVLNVCINLFSNSYCFCFCFLKFEIKFQEKSSTSRKPKVKKKVSDDISPSVGPDPSDLQGEAGWLLVSGIFNLSSCHLFYLNN